MNHLLLDQLIRTLHLLAINPMPKKMSPSFTILEAHITMKINKIQSLNLIGIHILLD